MRNFIFKILLNLIASKICAQYLGGLFYSMKIDLNRTNFAALLAMPSFLGQSNQSSESLRLRILGT